jgi:hypothetical protein
MVVEVYAASPQLKSPTELIHMRKFSVHDCQQLSIVQAGRLRRRWTSSGRRAA